MAYSFNMKREGLVFASAKDLNASFKDLGAVCDARKYKSAPHALITLESVATGNVPILYRRHNAYMGSRHELGGQREDIQRGVRRLSRRSWSTQWPTPRTRATTRTRWYVVHAAANKTMILPRTAPKGALWLGHSMGRRSARRTDLELARIEIGLGYGEEAGISEHMKRSLAAVRKADKKFIAPKAKEVKPKATKKPKEQAGKSLLGGRPKEIQKT